MRRLRLAIVLAGILATGVAAPVDARLSIASNVRNMAVGVDCLYTYTATWSGLPGRVRSYELYILSPTGPTYLLQSGPTGRSGSLGFNIFLEGSGVSGSRLFFYDSDGRVVRTADNEEGLIPYCFSGEP